MTALLRTRPITQRSTPGEREDRCHRTWHVAPNSPDLNPVDYAVWSAIQQQVCHGWKFNTVLQTVITEWTRRMAIANGTCTSFCSAISLTHILPPKYALGTIVVNVTWMKRGFNVCQTHRSIYPSIFNRLRAIARYWSEIETFPYSLAFNAPVGGVPIGIPGKSLVLRKLESWGYQAVKTVWR